MRAMARWGLVVLALVGGLVACSDGDDEGGGPTTTTEAEATSTTASLGPCPYVSTEQVAEAFTLAVELLEGREDACDFILGDNATLLVGGGQAADLDACDDGSVVEAEGGWACVAAGVPTAQVVSNEYVVGVIVTGEVAAEASRDALVRLIPLVTPGG